MGIRDALVGLAVGRTSVFVAHRLSTVMHCDEIVVLDKGHVVERGSHDTLLEDGGVYAEMWAAQAQSTRRDGAAAGGEEEEEEEEEGVGKKAPPQG